MKKIIKSGVNWKSSEWKLQTNNTLLSSFPTNFIVFPLVSWGPVWVIFSYFICYYYFLNIYRMIARRDLSIVQSTIHLFTLVLTYKHTFFIHERFQLCFCFYNSLECDYFEIFESFACFAATAVAIETHALLCCIAL